MKRIISTILVLAMVFALCSCGSATTGNPEPSETAPTQTPTNNTSPSNGLTGTGNEISVEDIFCSEDGDDYLNYQLKVRNNLDISVDGIRIQCKLIDAAGDSLDSFEWLFTDIEAGRTEQGYYQINDMSGYKLDDAYAFKLYSFEMVNYEPWEDIVKADFPEPIIIKLSEIPSK